MGTGNNLYVSFYSDQSAKGGKIVFGEAGLELVSMSMVLCIYLFVI